LNAATALPEPGLAERWEISTDGLVYTFHLRSNLTWSTGEPITADDVVYSWRRVLNPATASDYAGQLFFVKNAEAFCTGGIKDPARVGVSALDGRTVRVELNTPTPFFLDLCSFPTLAVVPRQAIERHGDRWLLTPPVPVSGPFRLESWRLQDRLRVRRNPRYWDAPRTRLEVVDFLAMDSPFTALNLFERDQADIIWDKNLVPTELMDVLRHRPDCHSFDYLGTFFYRYNVTRPPFNDVRVRKALALAIDRERLIEKITRGAEKPATHITPNGIPHYRPPEGLGFDPEAARQLLAEAGYPEGRGFPVFQYLLPTGKLDTQFAVEMQAMWARELGLSMELRQTEWKVYLNALGALDYQVGRSSWIGDYVDPNTFLDLFTSNNGNNRTGWKNARYDALIRDGNRQTHPGRREATLQQAETLLIREEVPVVPLYFYAGLIFFDPDRIEGVHFNLLDEHPIQAIRTKSTAARH
jgi:oligopeptide transport system substrate-binding protein